VEENGVVSIWFRDSLSKDDLELNTKIYYDDDDNISLSKFFLDFSIDIDEVDEDFIEIEFLDFYSENIERLLSGCSYYEKIINNLKKSQNMILKSKVNSVILIYNFNFTQLNRPNNSDFKYFDTVSYI
jgi:hypothetical protein